MRGNLVAAVGSRDDAVIVPWVVSTIRKQGRAGGLSLR
jgi:hypothetical protein